MVDPAKSENYRRALARVVREIGWMLDILLLLLMVAAALTFVPLLLPGLSERRLFQSLNYLLSPFYSVIRAYFPSVIGKFIGEFVGTFDLAPPVFFIALFLARNVLNWRIDKLSIREARRRELGALRNLPAAAEEDPAEARRKKAAARRIAVGQYAEAKALLDATKKDLSFVSLDIAGSTTMKIGEDPFVVEHAFVEYRKLVERIVERNAVYKAAWTPDGQMFAFRSPERAVWAAQQILADLRGFNRKVSKMKNPFRLRAGANCGIVSTDDATPMEQVSDESIDVAGHMQKHAEPGELWISGELHARIEKKDGFAENGKKVDGRSVFVWSPPPEAA